ncbi:MAG: hypothetical protein K2X87_05410 [Gemmataceae bacterium]|nr:hypothetical protein [Gemmataceae bacterium]
MWALTWPVVLLDRLAVAYVAADPDLRERMARGVEALNARLRADPLSVGESRDHGFRIACPTGLVVYFRVDAAARTVVISDVRPYGR